MPEKVAGLERDWLLILPKQAINRINGPSNAAADFNVRGHEGDREKTVMDAKKSSDNLGQTQHSLRIFYERLHEDPRFINRILQIYEIATEKSKIELPDVPLTKIIHDLLATELGNLSLTHDEVVKLVLAAKMLNNVEKDKQEKESRAIPLGMAAKVDSAEAYGKITLDLELSFGDPRESEYWISKGKMLKDSGLLNNAKRCFDKALDINIDNTEALCMKGWCLLDLISVGVNAVNNIWDGLRNHKNMLQEALSSFDRAIALDSKQAGAWLGKGRCLIELGKSTSDLCKVREAMLCFEKGLSIDRNNKDLRKALTECEQCMYGQIPYKSTKYRDIALLSDSSKATPGEFLEILKKHPSMQNQNIQVGHDDSVSEFLFQLLKRNPFYQQLYHQLPKDMQNYEDFELQAERLNTQLFETLLSYLTDRFKKGISQKVAFGEFLLTEANAFCARPVAFCSEFGPLCKRYSDAKVCLCYECEEYDGYIVGVHRGLSLLVNNVLRALLARSQVGKNEDRILEPILSHEEAVSYVYEISKLSVQGRVPGTSRKISFRDERMFLLGTISFYARLFVIAHELSHFLLGHLTDCSLVPVRLGDRFIKAFVWTKDQTKEFEADELGFAVLLNFIHSMRDDIAIMHAITATEVVFSVLELREKVGRFSPSTTHPPAEQRIFQLRQRFKFPERYYEVSDTTRSLSKSFIEYSTKRSIS